jgi:hypothetical protein
MITGQYTGKVLLNNNGIQKISYYEANNPEALKTTSKIRLGPRHKQFEFN